MDGIHDMGGMDGFGKVEPEPNEPPFHASWEGRVLAMQRAMGYAGAWHIDMSRFAQERLPPQVYVTASYYQRWALAMEKNVVERGYADAEELAAGHALRPGQAAQAQAHDRRRPARDDARFVLSPSAGGRTVQAG
jgi:nitrile hydratase